MNVWRSQLERGGLSNWNGLHGTYRLQTEKVCGLRGLHLSAAPWRSGDAADCKSWLIFSKALFCQPPVPENAMQTLITHQTDAMGQEQETEHD